MEEDELLAAIKPLATPKPLSTFATSMADGEMGIGGVVTSVGPNSFTLSSIDVVLPGGKDVAFDTPRPKTIALTDSTTITNGHSGKPQETVAVNTYVNIVGADQGSGKKLIAHRIQAY